VKLFKYIFICHPIDIYLLTDIFYAFRLTVDVVDIQTNATEIDAILEIRAPIPGILPELMQHGSV
jgi:hypothetical protein